MAQSSILRNVFLTTLLYVSIVLFILGVVGYAVVTPLIVRSGVSQVSYCFMILESCFQRYLPSSPSPVASGSPPYRVAARVERTFRSTRCSLKMKFLRGFSLRRKCA